MEFSVYEGCLPRRGATGPVAEAQRGRSPRTFGRRSDVRSLKYRRARRDSLGKIVEGAHQSMEPVHPRLQIPLGATPTEKQGDLCGYHHPLGVAWMPPRLRVPAAGRQLDRHPLEDLGPGPNIVAGTMRVQQSANVGRSLLLSPAPPDQTVTGGGREMTELVAHDHRKLIVALHEPEHPETDVDLALAHVGVHRITPCHLGAEGGRIRHGQQDAHEHPLEPHLLIPPEPQGPPAQAVVRTRRQPTVSSLIAGGYPVTAASVAEREICVRFIPIVEVSRGTCFARSFPILTG